MNRRSFRAGSIAAAVAWCTAIASAVVSGGLDLQPTQEIASRQDVLTIVHDHTGALLGFMAFDTIFIMSYIAVFAVTFLAIPNEDRLLGGIGLAFGILAGLADMLENTLYIAYGTGAVRANPDLVPSLPFHYYVSTVKWLTAFAAVGLQLLVFPRGTRLERAIVGGMATFPVLGAISIAWPSLLPLRALFFLIGLPLMAVYFHRLSRA